MDVDAGRPGRPELPLNLPGLLEGQAMLARFQRPADPLPVDADIEPVERAMFLDHYLWLRS